MANEKTWVGPTGIKYEFVEQFGRVMAYYEMNGRWIHATREFKNFDEVRQWQQQVVDEYNNRNNPPVECGPIDADPYEGMSGNYVGD